MPSKTSEPPISSLNSTPVKGSFTSSAWNSGPTPFGDEIPIQAQVCHELHTFALDEMQGKGYAVYLSCVNTTRL